MYNNTCVHRTCTERTIILHVRVNNFIITSPLLRRSTCCVLRHLCELSSVTSLWWRGNPLGKWDWLAIGVWWLAFTSTEACLMRAIRSETTEAVPTLILLNDARLASQACWQLLCDLFSFGSGIPTAVSPNHLLVTADVTLTLNFHAYSLRKQA